MTMQHQSIRMRTGGSINLDHYRDQALMLRTQSMSGFFKSGLPCEATFYAIVTTIVASVVITPIIAALAS